MSVTAVRTPAEYESRLRRYLFDRSEEGRAVRVGEKEVSERAEIVARYRDLFSREQLEALRSAEERRVRSRRPRAPLPAAQDVRSRGRRGRDRRARGRAGERDPRRARPLQGRGAAAAHRAGEARRAPGVRAIATSSASSQAEPLGRVQRRAARRAARRRGARGRDLRASRIRSRATRRRRASRCATSSARSPQATGAPTDAYDGSPRALVRAPARPRARRDRRRRTTSRTCAGSRRSSRRTRRSARSRSAWTRSTRLGFDLENEREHPARPRRPAAEVAARLRDRRPTRPTVVHLITRAQGGLHDYQAFLHEAGHALHYAGLRSRRCRTPSATSRATTR